MKSRPEPTRAATPPIRVASPRPHRRGERTVGFEGDQSKGESRVERNRKGGMPLEEAPRGNEGQSVNLPPLLAAHLGRGENGQPLQSSLTSVYGGQTLPNNIGGNLPPNDRGRFSPYKGQNQKLLSNLVKSPREILAIEKVAKTFEQPLRLPRANWSKDKTRYCHFYEDNGHETNQCREMKQQIEEAVKLGQLAHLVKGVKEKKEKTTGTHSEKRKKEEKKPTLDKVSVLMISGKNRNVKKRLANHDGIGEIMFPPLPNVGSSDPVIIKVYISGRQVNRAYLDGGSSCEVIYEHCFLKLKPLIRSLHVDSNTPLVGFSGEQS
ncbi:hypothetical protein Tco_0926710 [Tanacetum coccineum]|uniref:Uncharacterized protein n=1 Tax=Tanacetum coccineum TaxID=301880 RepID=A0ABQ5DAP4_9ASTR